MYVSVCVCVTVCEYICVCVYGLVNHLVKHFLDRIKGFIIIMNKIIYYFFNFHNVKTFQHCHYKEREGIMNFK